MEGNSRITELTPDERLQYHRGFDTNESRGDHKEYGHD